MMSDGCRERERERDNGNEMTRRGRVAVRYGDECITGMLNDVRGYVSAIDAQLRRRLRDFR